MKNQKPPLASILVAVAVFIGGFLLLWLRQDAVGALMVFAGLIYLSWLNFRGYYYNYKTERDSHKR